MLKIYRAIPFGGRVVLEDGITFYDGKFNTGYKNGFGYVHCKNPKSTYKFVANYDLAKLDTFTKYLNSLKTKDGYVENFALLNPYDYEMLKSYALAKSSESYKQYRLNEEAILLFTENVQLKYDENDLVQKIFGRNPETGMYLLKPNASLTMFKHDSFEKIEEDYEVLQSNSLGKRLSLVKMNRKI